MKLSGVKILGLVMLVMAMATCIGAWWGYAHLTSLVQARLKVLISNDISVGKVAAHWNRIELDRIRIARQGAGPFGKRLSIERIVIRPSLRSLLSGRLEIKEILVEKPYLLLEINRDGSMAKILPPRPAARSGSSTASLPFHLAVLRINNGSIDLLDWHVARKGSPGLSNPRDGYNLATLEKIGFSMGAISLPVTEQPVPLNCELTSSRGGHLLITGKVAPKGLDSHLTFDLSGLNITPYRPYFLKKGDLNVSAGSLSASSSLTITKRTLHAPGSLHLKGLAFDHSSAKGVLLGVPAWALVAFLSDNKDGLSLPFTINGNLDNPRFSIHQSLADQVATALSAKIGVPTVSGIGKGILGIGEKGIKGILGITGSKK